MERYDNIVVGGGISGLTATLLLALDGRKVLLLEKGPRIGGSLCRFRRNGVPFDTGFHFAGGFHQGGMLHEMLTVLGLRDAIKPIFLNRDHAHRFVFEDCGKTYELPCGTAALQGRLTAYFPGERAAIDGYFERLAKVGLQVANMSLAGITVPTGHIEEDFVSLQEVLDGLTANEHLKALVSAFCMCYGVRPAEISFANHARICLGLYESVARVENGGQAFVEAFAERFSKLEVAARTDLTIEECLDVADRRVGRFRLTTGEEVTCDTCIFTIHPQEILAMLPREKLTKAFVDRIGGYESSAGFFSVFATLETSAGGPGFGATVVSLFPHADVNRMLDPENDQNSALVLVSSREHSSRGEVNILTAFEPSFMNHVAQWKETRLGERPASYCAYKQRRVESICERIARFNPTLGEHMHVLDSASVLTLRDYLFSPDGSAYGVKQKLGQFNLLGKLPLLNLYAAGQSALLPGVVGAMMSSFLVCRAIIGKEKFKKFIERGLCR